MRALHIPEPKPTPGSSTTPTLPSSFPPTPNFHNTTLASTASTTVKQPRLRASCDGCFLAKVKCTKSRPVCSRCLAVGLVCRYSPSSRSLGSHSRQQARDRGEGGGKSRKSRVRRNGGTAVLASTMSEESCAWLAQQGGGFAWGGNVGGDVSASFGTGRVDGGFEWDLTALSMPDQGFDGTLTSEWMTPESQGWIQFAYPTFENGANGSYLYWQTMREVSSPFSIGSSEVDEVAGGEFAVNLGQWVG